MRDWTASMVGVGAGRRDVRLLFTCAGRRIELIQAFVRAAGGLGLRPRIHAADSEEQFSAACVADQAHRVPVVGSRGYMPAIERIARRHRIDLVVPLLDSELLKLARAREGFARFGCGILISSPGVVRICRDKVAMFEFLVRHDIDTPHTWTPADKIRRHAFPYFLKPRAGSASKSSYVIQTRADLDALVGRVPDAIIQEFVAGTEYTLDVYSGYDGRPCCVVPRRRLEVRGGEVTKARTVKHGGIMEVGRRVVSALGECVGLITVQVILGPKGRIAVIEVNPRFGGGVPLAIHAGADFPRWLLAEWLGRRPRIRLDHFRDGVTMLRYHQSFFLDGS